MSRESKRTWTASEVREKLRGRHPATQTMGVRLIPGPWTCIEEWCEIDLLAIASVQRPAQGSNGGSYPVVGYEVKVDRGDYRSELRKPEKRQHALTICNEFYFAVPRGLLRDDEIDATAQPELGEPSLWVPGDVGLVVVDGRGCRVAKPAPLNRDPDPIFSGGYGRNLGNLVRWVSARPDPRHDGLVDQARRTGRFYTALRNGKVEAYCDRCHVLCGEHAVGESCANNCGGTIVKQWGAAA
jgi:hypothetical protein